MRKRFEEYHLVCNLWKYEISSIWNHISLTNSDLRQGLKILQQKTVFGNKKKTTICLQSFWLVLHTKRRDEYCQVESKMWYFRVQWCYTFTPNEIHSKNWWFVFYPYLEVAIRSERSAFLFIVHNVRQRLILFSKSNQ